MTVQLRRDLWSRGLWCARYDTQPSEFNVGYGLKAIDSIGQGSLPQQVHRLLAEEGFSEKTGGRPGKTGENWQRRGTP